MKAITLLFLTLVISSLTLSAQIPETTLKFQEKEFEDYLKKDTIKQFNIYPKFKHPKNHNSWKFAKSKPIKRGEDLIELNMPILAFGPNPVKMPIMVPDTSVHFYLKEKRIEFINPKEKFSK